MTEKRRWKTEKTPSMRGDFLKIHMRRDIWAYNRFARLLPKTRKNMMFNIRKRFRSRKVI